MATKLYKRSASSIHNSGLFATQDIEKGARIIEYLGERITKAESERRAIAWAEKARKKGKGLVYIFELNKRYDIDGNIPSNPARQINHSCEANCEAEIVRGHIWILAAQDIKKGDELTYDYGYDLEHFLDHPCLCGKPSCVGYIVRKDQRWRVKRILQKMKSAEKNTVLE